MSEVDDLVVSELKGDESKYVWDRWQALKGKQSLWLRRPRWCPNCLTKAGYGRIGWELLFADACAACGHWLADVCLACGTRVSWSRVAFFLCKCGSDLSNQASLQAPDAVVRLSRSLEQLALGGARTELPELSSLSPEQCNKLIRVLGAYGASTLQRSPQKILSADSMDVSWTVTSVAGEVLAGWPLKFKEFLALQSNRVTDSEKAGRMSGVFGGFYRALYQGLKGPEFDWVRRAFEYFIVERWTGTMGDRNRRLPFGIRARLSWLPLSEAIRLGWSRRAIVDLIESGAIRSASRKTRSGREFVMILRADIETHASKKPLEMSLIEASASLGIKRQRLGRLIPVICPSARKTTLVGTPWRIPSAWVKGWEGRLERLDPVPLIPSTAVSLDHLFRYGPLEEDRLAKLLIDLEQGKLSAIGKDSRMDGLPGLLFLRTDIETKYRTTPGDIFSVPAAANYLGIKQEVGYALARLSLLATQQFTTGRRTARGVSLGAIKQFQAAYVFATELAKIHSCSCSTIALALSRHGIEPVASRAMGNCRQILYRRADLLSVEWVVSDADPRRASDPLEDVKSDSILRSSPASSAY